MWGQITPFPSPHCAAPPPPPRPPPIISPSITPFPFPSSPSFPFIVGQADGSSLLGIWCCPVQPAAPLLPRPNHLPFVPFTPPPHFCIFQVSQCDFESRHSEDGVGKHLTSSPQEHMNFDDRVDYITRSSKCMSSCGPNPHPKPALSLTHDLLCVLSMDTWWNFGHELKKKATSPAEGHRFFGDSVTEEIRNPCFAQSGAHAFGLGLQTNAAPPPPPFAW